MADEFLRPLFPYSLRSTYTPLNQPKPSFLRSSIFPVHPFVSRVKYCTRRVLLRPKKGTEICAFFNNGRDGIYCPDRRFIAVNIRTFSWNPFDHI